MMNRDGWDSFTLIEPELSALNEDLIDEAFTGFDLRRLLQGVG